MKEKIKERSRWVQQAQLTEATMHLAKHEHWEQLSKNKRRSSPTAFEIILFCK
jgi:hypothetical protein